MFIRKELLQLSPCAHGGRLHEIAERRGLKDGDLLDFSVNLNPYLPFDGRDAIAKACAGVDVYPDNRYGRFCGSAAKFCGARPGQIIPGNGSSEIIRLFAEVALTKGDIVAIPGPTFGEYEQQCRLFGAGVRHVKMSDIVKGEFWHLDGCRATFFCNPNNPDGRLMPAGFVLKLADYCRERGIALAVDEAFIDLADPGQSVARHVEGYDNLLVLRSLTKCFAIPGFRLGFGVACREAADALNVIRLTWNVDSVAAETGAYYMDHASSYLGLSREFIRREREWMAGEIAAIKGLTMVPSSVNFFLVDVSGAGKTSSEFAARMLERGIVVRDCSSFRMLGDSYVRLAVRTREENERLVKALKAAAGSL
ncbi:MAG: Aspartate aminotransferase [Methanocella sp. PtaU1.Bin125]|nr:MAG: Aspartate aminotransferase [Methanocella sp. PtaU1.Bin125]